MKLPPGVGSLIELEPQAQESLERWLEKTLALMRYLRSNRSGSVQTELLTERYEHMKPVEKLLRQAIEDRRLEGQVREEAGVAWSAEMRYMAIWVITASEHLRTVSDETREHWKKTGEEQAMAEKSRELESMRGPALSRLGPEDLEWLNEQGFVRAGEFTGTKKSKGSGV